MPSSGETWAESAKVPKLNIVGMITETFITDQSQTPLKESLKTPVL